jgi:hypothetical protein
MKYFKKEEKQAFAIVYHIAVKIGIFEILLWRNC